MDLARARSLSERLELATTLREEGCELYDESCQMMQKGENDNGALKAAQVASSFTQAKASFERAAGLFYYALFSPQVRETESWRSKFADKDMEVCDVSLSRYKYGRVGD